MCPNCVVIVSIAAESALQVTFSQDDRVVEAFPPYAADDPFGRGILPRCSTCTRDCSDLERTGLPAERLSVNGITMAQQVSRRLVQSAGLHKLPRRPGSCGILHHVEMQNPSRSWPTIIRTNRSLTVAVDTVKKSSVISSLAWF